MARLDVNRSGEMEVFVKVVEQAGFSAAARAFRMTPSAVSKLVSRLETRLGARLVNRSTRRLQLTAEGRAFYERAVEVLADLDAAERSVAADEVPSGPLRVNATLAFGTHLLIPSAPEFLARHPAVSLNIVLTDAVVDLMAERTDIAVRTGPLKGSTLVARKLGASRMVIVGAPDYLAARGTPQAPEDLNGHNLCGFCFQRQVDGWPLTGLAERLIPAGNTQLSDGESLRHLVLAGGGLARLALYHVAADIASGRLVPVLEAFNPGDLEPTHAVYLGQGGHMPARVRAYLDFLVAVVAPRFMRAGSADPQTMRP